MPIKPHPIRGATKASTPPAVMCFDTETWNEHTDMGIRLRLRCWNACTVWRKTGGADHDGFEHTSGELPGDFTVTVNRQAETVKELWIIAHNLGFDLQTTSLPYALHHTGWTIASHSFTDESSWFVYEREGHRIVLGDSYSWLRCSLAEVGKDIRKRKLALPDDDDSLAAWHKRCRRDVEILTEAVARLLDWWDENGSGRFRVTGASLGFAMLKARTRKGSILVGPEAPRTAFERKAIHSGRKEVYRVGKTLGGTISDYDFVSAYPTVCATLPLPNYPKGRLTSAWRRRLDHMGLAVGIIADCKVTTEKPVVPVRHDDATWWPTGTFVTTLTTPEIAYAKEAGASVEIGEGYVYELSDALAPWARWCLNLIHDRSGAVDPIITRLAKGWSRSVPGRFAAHRSQYLRDWCDPGFGMRVWCSWSKQHQARIETLVIDSKAKDYIQDMDGYECFPAVFAYIEAYCRVGLGRVLARRNPWHLIACNTDGWMEHRPAGRAALTLDKAPSPFSVVRKAHYKEVEVFGPDHYVYEKGRKLAGIPRHADQTADRLFEWHDWPALRWQLEHSDPGVYLRNRRAAQIDGNYVNRWILATRETVPVTMRLDAAGENELMPWSETMHRLEGDELIEDQVARLAKLADSPGPVKGPAATASRYLPGRLPRQGDRYRPHPAR